MTKCLYIQTKVSEYQPTFTRLVYYSAGCSACCSRGCFRRDDTFFTLAFSVVVVGGFSNSSNCLSVNRSLYQSALRLRDFKSKIWLINPKSNQFGTMAKSGTFESGARSWQNNELEMCAYHSGIWRAQSHRFVTSLNAWPSLHPLRLGCSPLMHT